MNLEILVSVVIPYYNDGKYIDDAVNSILNQTHKNIEIIIINDGSNDSYSIEKLKKYQNSEINIIHQENQGGATARNVGFELSKSEFILTLDADDIFENSFIEKALDILLKDKNIGAVSSWARGFGVREFLWELKGGAIENFIYSNQSVACGLIRKSAWIKIKGYRKELRNNYEDWDFWLRLTNLGYFVHVIPEPLFLYRQKENSMVLETFKKHSEMYKKIIIYNEDIFNRFWMEILFQKENELSIDRNSYIQSLLNSKEYRLGSTIFNIFRFIKKLFSLKY